MDGGPAGGEGGGGNDFRSVPPNWMLKRQLDEQTERIAELEAQPRRGALDRENEAPAGAFGTPLASRSCKILRANGYRAP